ncbi:MAG: hypothetical protein ACREEM_34000 [Blastocatellia bacterium]
MKEFKKIFSPRRGEEDEEASEKSFVIQTLKILFSRQDFHLGPKEENTEQTEITEQTEVPIGFSVCSVISVCSVFSSSSLWLRLCRAVLFVSSWLLLFLVMSSTALAQCAMCKANVAHAENAAEVSARMNQAVLVLLIPTFLIIGGIVRLIFKYRNHQNDNDNIRSARSQRRSQ